MPTTLGVIQPSPANNVKTSAKLWRGWRRKRTFTGTWLTSDHRGGDQLFIVREAIQLYGRPHGPPQVVTQDLHRVHQSWSDVCAVQTRGEDLAATSSASSRNSGNSGKEDQGDNVMVPSSLRNTAMANSSWGQGTF